MKDWKKLLSTNTFRELIDLFNINSENSDFLDSMIGKILGNGVLFNGNETIDGLIIQPLKAVNLTGTVNSNTEFDNFDLYFRDTNKIVSLNKFPIDLLSYADAKPHFLYIKEDLTYRVSDYMFGAADEILLCRFVINTNSTWNHLYIMAQRAGTPMYSSADEFYNVEGMYVKSPGGLELSQTSGTVKRSGIDFTDMVSPDISQFYNISSERVPIRYINNYNEIDYTKDVTYEVESNKYMIYNMNKNLKIEAEELIRQIKNLYYGIEHHSNSVALELHNSIISGGNIEDLSQIVNSYVDYITIIYSQVTKLYNLLGNEVLSDVRRAGLKDNQNLVNNYLDLYLRGDAIAEQITEVQVTAIQNMVYYILNTNLSVCNIPLENELQNVLDDLNGISFDAGSILPVPNGKFTIQRILWDVYEQTLICQYGDTIYDTLNEAIEGTGLLSYPAPFGKTIYIPLAIIILKSGITSINDDTETLIIDRRWIEVDQENSGYADYVARARADKALSQIADILSGKIAVNKADSLKCTVNGEIVYKDGDYYLNYDNLVDSVKVINNLTTSSFNSKQALSAYQGYVLNQNKVEKSGDTMNGTLNTTHLFPKTTNLYNLGSSSLKWNNAYINEVFISSNGNIYKDTTNNTYIYSSGSSVLDIRAMSKSSADSSWSSLPNKTLVFCW